MNVHEPTSDDDVTNAVASVEIGSLGPIFDGELVDDKPATSYGRPHAGRFVSWCLRSPRVPVWLKDRRQAVQAGKDLAVGVLRSPWRYLGAVARGMVAAGRWWRRWVTIRDYREAAESAEKLADKFVEIRALTLFRWKVTGAAVGATIVAVFVLHLVYGDPVWWVVGVCGSAALAVLGRRKDGSPGRRAVLAGPRTLTWTMDPQVLVDAFRDAKLIGKDETLRLVERATRIGDGWAITVDLPAASPRKHGMYYRCPARTLAPGSPALASHPPAVYLREDPVRDAVNGWLGDLFARENVDRTVAALVGSQGGESSSRESVKARLANAEAKLRRLQAAIEAGVEPAALVESINEAQAHRSALRAELGNVPADGVQSDAEIYARVDALVELGTGLSGASTDRLASFYTAVDLRVCYDHDSRTADVSIQPLMRVNSACVRGGT